MPVRTLLIRWASALQSVQRIERLAKVTSGSVRLHRQHGVCFTICACALRRSVSSCDVIHFCIVVIRCNSEGIPAACLSCQATGIMKRAVIRSSRNHLVKCFLLACRQVACYTWLFFGSAYFGRLLEEIASCSTLPMIAVIFWMSIFQTYDLD